MAGKVKTVSVTREGCKWFVVLTAEQAAPDPLPATGSVVGIDLGIANFLADSDGGFVENPRHGRKAAEKVAALHRKVRRRRLDHAHKTALDLVREHDFIAHEDLKIRNMSRAPAPKPDPDQPGSFLPSKAAGRAGLNRWINDAGWGCSSRSGPPWLKAPDGT
ncbi:RNA-guided endonuclease InsQ/TnpB family protein [Streptomyces sp. NBC_01320]|uniref:RNA-guided endonuclease InsQ/TnpB family protein n=1 Tax=Streptomyces sp. NBC_01320 TaxID=2903824 RepID=UPI003FA348B9